MEHSLRLDKPNLKTAKNVTIVAAISQLFTCYLLMEILTLEWVSQISSVYVVAGLANIWAYYYFCQYLKNFNLDKIMVMAYILIGCMAASAFSPVINSFLISYKLHYLSPFISLGLGIVGLASIAALYVLGINLFRFQEDAVGGLSLVGKLFTLKATLATVGILYYIYYYIRMYSSDYAAPFMTSTLSIEHLTNSLTVVLNIATLAAIIHSYKNAEEYKMYTNYEEDSDIMDEIDDIGVN